MLQRFKSYRSNNTVAVEKYSNQKHPPLHLIPALVWITLYPRLHPGPHKREQLAQLIFLRLGQLAERIVANGMPGREVPAFVSLVAACARRTTMRDVFFKTLNAILDLC